MDKAVDVSAYFYGVKEDVSADYRDLALFLGITDTRNIESRNPDATSCCLDVLQTWKRAKGDEATVEVLLQALMSAELESAADNLRKNLGKEDYPRPTPLPNQVNVQLPKSPENNETCENARTENCSFSCRIWKCLDISCMCNFEVLIIICFILYAICLIIRPHEVLMITIAGAFVYFLLISMCHTSSFIPQRKKSEDWRVVHTSSHLYTRPAYIPDGLSWQARRRHSVLREPKAAVGKEFAPHPTDQMVA